MKKWRINCCCCKWQVAPILALLLGAKEQLVVQVVPHALFDFSVTVMRACFSAVLQKHVYTFSYDRFTTPSTALLQKLLKAKVFFLLAARFCLAQINLLIFPFVQASRGLVVTTPTALKSFSLKCVYFFERLECVNLLYVEKTYSRRFVETCNAIVELRAAIAAGTADLSKLSYVALLGLLPTRWKRLFIYR